MADSHESVYRSVIRHTLEETIMGLLGRMAEQVENVPLARSKRTFPKLRNSVEALGLLVSELEMIYESREDDG